MSVRAEKGCSLYEVSWVLSRGRRGRVPAPTSCVLTPVLQGTVSNSSASEVDRAGFKSHPCHLWAV